jgi:hypothetical protein
MQRVDFYKLERSLQDRFINATRGEGLPTPIVVRETGQWAHIAWAGAGALLVVSWAFFVTVGYGELDHPLALASPVWLVVHVAFGIGLGVVTVRAMAARWELRASPFRPGVYVFPGCVVDARRRTFRVWSIEEVSEFRASAGKVTVALRSGPSFSFPTSDPQALTATLKELEQASQRFSQVLGGAGEISALDPLRDSGIPNPLAPTERIQRRRFMNPVIVAVACGAAACALAWAVWSVRNQLSARVLYRAATERNDTAAYRAYLERGGERQEVREILLPRAELRDAMAKDSVEAIEDYVKKHGQSKIEGEVSAVHRAALLKELERARRAGTVTALKKLKERYPSGFKLIENEWQAAKRALYDAAFGRFEAAAGEEAGELVPFFRKLLDYAAQHGPRVDVRFHQRAVPSRGRIDEMLRKNPYYTDKNQSPAQYFDAGQVRKHEQASGQRIIAAFQKLFPEDMLDFELGDKIGDAVEETPTPKVPTLFVEHRTQLSGGYLSSRPRAVFVGAAFMFEAFFVLPGESSAPALKYSLWRPPDLKQFQEEGKKPPELYEAMNREGFDRFTDRLLKDWLGRSG